MYAVFEKCPDWGFCIKLGKSVNGVQLFREVYGVYCMAFRMYGFRFGYQPGEGAYSTRMWF